MNERRGEKTLTERIVSIDVLRGFDMLLLCGGAAVSLKFMQRQSGGDLPGWLEGQFMHAECGGAFCAGYAGARAVGELNPGADEFVLQHASGYS